MKKLLMVMVLLLAASSAFAQVKIGYVNIQKVIATSDKGQKFKVAMAEEEKTKSAKIQTLREEYMKMEKDYATQEKALTEAAKKTRIEALQKKAMEVETTARNFSMELQKKNNDMVNEVLKEVEVVVQEVAKAGKYDLVLVNEAIYYSSNTVKDLTDEILKKYNTKGK